MGAYEVSKKNADPKRLPKMKAKWKKKWLEALRSDKYKQGRSVLAYTEDCETYYCCLGVLCDIVKDEMGDDFDIYDNSVPPQEVWELVLTKKTLKKAGASAEALWNDYYDGDDVADAKRLSAIPLISRNDGFGAFEGRQQSFKKIANIIEKHM